MIYYLLSLKSGLSPIPEPFSALKLLSANITTKSSMLDDVIKLRVDLDNTTQPTSWPLQSTDVRQAADVTNLITKGDKWVMTSRYKGASNSAAG